MKKPSMQDHWARFERWSRRYRRTSAEFVAAHADEGDWYDPRWLAYASRWELRSPDAYESIHDMEEEVERRVQQKLRFLRAYLVHISADGPAFMAVKSRFLSCQYPSRCDAAWGFWFEQSMEGDLEIGGIPGFQEFEAELFLNTIAEADFGSIRSVLPFDTLIVRRPYGEIWSAATAAALVVELRRDMEFDAYFFEVDLEGIDTALLCIEFHWLLAEKFDFNQRDATMIHRKSSIELPPLSIKPGTHCWQIDSDRLSSPLDEGGWLEKLSERLIEVAVEHPNLTLYAATWVGPSVEFGSGGWSTWFAMKGPKVLRDRIAAVLRELLPSRLLKTGITDASQSSWLDSLYIAQGCVWRPWDASEWICVQPNNPDATGDEQVLPDLSSTGDSEEYSPDDAMNSPVAEVKPPKQALRYRAAKGDASVGTIQATIEKMFKLPEGSVKLINPDKSFSNRNQSIRRLRERWEAS